MTPANLSKFIVDERPLLVFRSLVRELGLPEAVFLQQLHYWLFTKSQSPERYADHFIQDRFWVHWTYEEMRAEIPLGTSTFDTHKRVIRKLRQSGILLVAKHGQAWDQTNWYSINYPAFGCAIGAQPGEDPSSGGGAAGASVALPPLQDRRVIPSKNGNSTDHYQTTQTSPETTTTTNVVAASKAGSGSSSVELDLTGIPEPLWPEVCALLGCRSDGQRFADQLAAGLERSSALPESRRIQSPILWLRKLLSDPVAVDFSAADAVAARRMAVALAQRRAAERTAQEAAEIEQREAEAALRADEAQLAIASMSPDARVELISSANRMQPSRRSAAEVERSISAGQLPVSPLARLAVFKALAAMPSLISSARGAP
jgi:hypothetical protein